MRVGLFFPACVALVCKVLDPSPKTYCPPGVLCFEEGSDYFSARPGPLAPGSSTSHKWKFVSCLKGLHCCFKWRPALKLSA